MSRLLSLALVLCILTLVPGVQADHSPSHVIVENKGPHVTIVEAPDRVAPVAGGFRQVNVSIEVFEPNGWQDIHRVEVVVFHPDNQTELHRFDASSEGAGQGPRQDYKATFTMPFYVAPADREGGYVIEVVATDHPGVRSDPAYHLFGYDALTAMSVETEQLHFSETGPGEASDPVPVRVRNVGNVVLGMEVSGTPLVSQGGHSIPESSVKVDGANEAYEQGMPLSQSAQRLSGFALEPGPDSWHDTWWVLSVPSGDAGYVPAGEYAGSIQLDGIDGRS